MKDLSEFELCAVKIRALADPIRLKIVQALFLGPSSVSALCELIKEEIVLVSRHLQILKHAGIVKTKRQGKHIIYSLGIATKTKKTGQIDFGCCLLDMQP